MYLDYVKERQGFDCIETDQGFLFYKISDVELYIAELYVKPEFRKTDAVKELVSRAAELALFNKCKFLTGNIYLADQGHLRTIKAALKLDFYIVRANNDIIVIARKIGE